MLNSDQQMHCQSSQHSCHLLSIIRQRQSCDFCRRKLEFSYNEPSEQLDKAGAVRVPPVTSSSGILYSVAHDELFYNGYEVIIAWIFGVSLQVHPLSLLPSFDTHQGPGTYEINVFQGHMRCLVYSDNVSPVPPPPPRPEYFFFHSCHLVNKIDFIFPSCKIYLALLHL